MFSDPHCSCILDCTVHLKTTSWVEGFPIMCPNIWWGPQGRLNTVSLPSETISVMLRLLADCYNIWWLDTPFEIDLLYLGLFPYPNSNMHGSHPKSPSDPSPLSLPARMGQCASKTQVGYRPLMQNSSEKKPSDEHAMRSCLCTWVGCNHFNHFSNTNFFEVQELARSTS